MIAIVLDNVNIGFDDIVDPERNPIGFLMKIVDPQSGIEVHLPLLDVNARGIGNHLLRKPSVAVASQMPPAPPKG